MRLEGRVALVLGGGAGTDGIGNGAAIAITYARAGAAVIVADRDLASAERTVEAVKEAGGSGEAAEVEVTEAASLARLADQSGPVDLLHCNVGVTRLGSPPALSEEDWRFVLDTNLTSAFLACRAFLPGMIERGRGAIVSTSSLAGARHTGYDYSAYYVAKAGLNHLTRTLAVELAPKGIRVNAVVPGLIDSPLIYRQLTGAYASVEAMVEARSRSVPMARMGTVWEVASAALFLASDAASYVTGVCLPVDGGLGAQFAE